MKNKTKQIMDALSNSNSKGMDAGTLETFYKIKGVDCYGRVCDNLRKYATQTDNAIMLKYVFLPGINDNKIDVNGFFELATELNIANVLISYDFNEGENLNEIMIEMVNYFADKCKDLKISCVSTNKEIARITGVKSHH